MLEVSWYVIFKLQVFRKRFQMVTVEMGWLRIQNLLESCVTCMVYQLHLISVQPIAVIEWLAQSKTISIAEVVELYKSLARVVNHFCYSMKNKKNKEALHSAMELVNMTLKHILSWCGTQMAHFLDACTDIILWVYFWKFFWKWRTKSKLVKATFKFHKPQCNECNHKIPFEVSNEGVFCYLLRKTCSIIQK